MAARPLAMAIKLKPDVVVMDIGMPSLNGIEACRHSRMAAPEIPGGDAEHAPPTKGYVPSGR